jgi:uncharacterized protein (DUF58 family)
VNFARLNHILIPPSKAGRDRFRETKWGRALVKAFGWALTLTDEGLGALLLWLFALAFAVNVGTRQFYFLWSGLTGLLVAAVLWSFRFKLKKTSLEIRIPKRISVGEKMTFRIGVRNDGEEILSGIRIHLPFLPWDGVWKKRPKGFSSIASMQIGMDDASAVFIARGLHHLDLFYASRVLPFGLSHGPPISGGCPKFHVVPKIANVKSFDLPSIHRYQPGGVALASCSGESRELIGVRPYRPGDPIRDIHAASWARVGEPQVREYRQEYFTRIGVVVDTDKTALREETFEAALSLTAGILSHLSRGEALIDLIVFGDEIHPFTLGRHLGFLDQALDLLAEVSPMPPWSLETLMRRVEPHLARLSALVFVTLADDEKRRAFEEFALSRNVGIRSVLVTDNRKSGSRSTNPRCLEIAAAQIFDSEEIHL